MTGEYDEVLGDLQEALSELTDRGEEQLAHRLARLFAVIAREASRRKSFSDAMFDALGPATAPRSGEDRVKSHHRTHGLIDPFGTYQSGEEELRRKLSALTVEQLKDIIAEHGMDRDKLAMKWRTTDRLIERIVETVKARTAKGQVFLR